MRKQLLFLLVMLWAGITVAAEQTPSPEFYVSEGDYEYVVGVFGEGEIHLFMDGVEVENPCWIQRDDDVDKNYLFEAYAQAEGCLPSEWVACDVFVPALALEPPIPPILPGFDLVVTDEYVFLELGNAGEEYDITVYVDGILMNPPYVFPRWEEDYLVFINVCFAKEGYNDFSEGREYVVPALEGAPHDVNSDGRVSIDDVTALIQYLLTLNTEGFNVEKADVDGDSRINIDDVTELINRLLNIPEWW